MGLLTNVAATFYAVDAGHGAGPKPATARRSKKHQQEIAGQSALRFKMERVAVPD